MSMHYPPITQQYTGPVDYKGIVSNLDITPTMYELAGVTSPGYVLHGESLVKASTTYNYYDFDLRDFTDRTVMLEWGNYV